MSERHRRLFFFAMFALVFYLVGASFVESFVTYPTWRFVGRNQFPAYYHELASRIVRIMVLPGVLEIPLSVALLWFRPRVIGSEAVLHHRWRPHWTSALRQDVTGHGLLGRLRTRRHTCATIP